jgi:predicted RNA-binding protein with TRAM domain
MSTNSPKPVELGKEYTVDIIGTGESGDGVARVQNFVIFVKNGKAGDKNVRIRINSVGNRFAIAAQLATSCSCRSLVDLET